LSVGGLDGREEFGGVPALLARTEARPFAATERHVVVDPAEGKLTITMPASELRSKWVACFRLVVHIPDDKPSGVSFATANALS
jgi:hypothetical protein